MKKKIAAIMIAALAGTMLLGGCGSKSAETGSSSSESSLKEENRTIKTRELLKLVDYDPEDYVKLPEDYMKMKVTLYKDDYKVTSSDVKDYIKSNILTQYPSYNVKTGKKTVAKKDVVNIDYTGKINGKTFDGGSAKDKYVTIGSGTMIDGFEDGLIGKKVGSTVKLNLKFPSDYSVNKSLQGKKAVFSVKINYIAKAKKVTYKTMNDAYVKQNFTSYGCSTVEELKKYVQQILETNTTSQESSDKQNKVLEKLVDGSEVEVPADLLNKRIEQEIKAQEAYAKSADQTLEEFLKQNYSMTEEQYKKQLKSSLPDYIKKELILQAVIKDQKITVNGSDYNSWVTNFMSSNYISSLSKFYKEYEVYGGRNYILMQYAESQALSKVVDSTSFVEKLGSSKDDKSQSSDKKTSDSSSAKTE
ncbi:FKBP-type peptidyl-prolyl cis-trans isomerase [Clostridium sp. SY8519]|uniref:trigger factor n=1 Tax=Clostridium sp. (strain SY8519) TaxID=1042156 RepID=UPI0002171C05|nr:trigger factor [Clostridium sp. SY8519]BAK47631.1 FKBP-type peptidyl-prolyl cis-trans isomerase [Clostridium sp. SY8519]